MLMGMSGGFWWVALKETAKRKWSAQLGHPTGWLGRLAAGAMKNANASAYQELESLLPLPMHGHLLEVGFGPGDGLARFGQNTQLQLTGLDPSALMVEMAAKRNAALLHTGRLKLIQADLLTADLPASSFDRVLALNVLYFWSELLPAFQKLYASLRPDGVAVFFVDDVRDLRQGGVDETVFHLHLPLQIKRALEEAGFTEVIHHRSKGHYFLAKRKALV